MVNRNYPTTVHYFPDVVADNGIYVDKTRFIEPLLAHRNQKSFFLSRPRRFGKSMFLSAIEHLFLGRKDLFQGLYIYDKIKWEDYNYPIIRLSMDKIRFATLGLETALMKAVQTIAKDYEIQLDETDSGIAFQELFKKLTQKYQKGVVVLIDEYDKPIIYYIEEDNAEQAERNRDILKNFYGVLKDNAQYLRFTFITGVSRFSKVSIFSDLNYFEDITSRSVKPQIVAKLGSKVRSSK